MNKYPSAKDGDEYIELLAQGGYMIGAIASPLFPDAILVDEPNHAKAMQLTREYFQRKNVTQLSPHKSLPPFEIDGKDVAVSEGTGAIRAYQAMLYGPQKKNGSSHPRSMEASAAAILQTRHAGNGDHLLALGKQTATYQLRRRI